MTTGYNGKFVWVGEFPAALAVVMALCQKSLDPRKFPREFYDTAPSPKRPCMTSEKLGNFWDKATTPNRPKDSKIDSKILRFLRF